MSRTNPWTRWAPRASSVEILQEDGQRWALEPTGDGWWSTTRQPAGTYRLVVDGAPIPDPWSQFQPAGVDGPSAPVDHTDFDWHDGGWTAGPFADAVVYELHVGTFTPEGTFDAIIDRLDHFTRLGVTAIEIMPVNAFSGDRGWGYDGVLWFAPHHAYGGPAGLKRLIDACHRRGIAVVLDVVYNHLGPVGNHLAMLGPFFHDHRRTAWGDAVNLDGPGSDGVRRFVVDNAVSWIRDYHADGLRLDAVHALVDGSATHIVEEIATAVHRLGAELGRDAWVIAESDLNDPRVVRHPEAGGYRADAAWSDDLHHALHSWLTGETAGYYGDFDGITDVAVALRRVYVYDGSYAPSRQRRHGRPVGDLDRSRFVGYTQTHDQVGNRALGERLVHLAGPDRAAAAAALVLLGPFVPMLFQGEEWAASSPFLYFTDHADPHLAEAVRRGRQAEFASFLAAGDVPDPQARSTFERSTLRWDEIGSGTHGSMLDWYRTLIALRRGHPELRDGSPGATAVTADPAGWIRMDRGPFSVVSNQSGGPIALPPGTVLARFGGDRSEGDGVAGGADAELRSGATVVVQRD